MRGVLKLIFVFSAMPDARRYLAAARFLLSGFSMGTNPEEHNRGVVSVHTQCTAQASHTVGYNERVSSVT